MPTYSLENTTIDGIPLLTLAPEGAKNLPAVIFLHGFGGQKEHGLELGYRLARRGLCFIALDAPMHGERLAPPIAQIGQPAEGRVYPLASGLDDYFLMNQVVAQAVAEIGRLIPRLAADPRLDGARIGMTGLSMGGFAAFLAAATLPEVRAAVPMIGIPAFAQRWEDVTLEASTYPEWARALQTAAPETARRAEFIRGIDPFERLEYAAPKPLLMLQGDLDLDAPKHYAVSLYRRLLPAYAAHPERLQLRIFDGVAHRVSIDMMEAAAGWFEQYL